MSRVTFHSPSGEAELLGQERAHANVLTTRLAHACLQPPSLRERYESLVPSTSYLHVVKPEAWDQAFRTWWAVGDEPLNVPGKGQVSTWDLTLNTALVVGSCAVELLARVHATCEIHGYVEGPNREWLADIIEVGRHDHVLRLGMGWEAVMELLLSRDDEPVVMSYSVTESFPNAEVADFSRVDGEDADDWWERWYNLADAEKWERSLRALREQSGGWLELHPDTWGLQGFGPLGWSVFDLEAWLDSQLVAPSGE